MATFILGTANFSGEYGIASHRNIEENQLQEIVTYAQENGINRFDTAIAYGESQTKLGKLVNKSKNFKFDSKISNKECQTSSLILKSVERSLQDLDVNKLSTLYLHDPKSLLGENKSAVIKGLTKLLDLNLVDYIGVSTYTLKEVIECKRIFPELTRFQLPENICDRRLINSKEIAELVSLKNEINIRSIFLQGLLLMNSQLIPKELKEAKDVISEFELYSKSCKVSRLDFCLAYAKSIPWASNLIIGVESKLHLQEIIKSDYKLNEDWENRISKLPEMIIDPRNWTA
jgi:aryl-alcohol dehydrogenase-like predicted oxidoreductase